MRCVRTNVASIMWAASFVVAAESIACATDWLRGSGNELEMRLNVSLISPDAHAVDDAIVTATLKGHESKRSFTSEQSAGRHVLWLPVNKFQWYSLQIQAEDRQGRIVYREILTHQLRKAAEDGLTLTLQTPSRHIAVSVTHEGKPVGSGVNVRASFRGAEQVALTDADGVAHFNVLPDLQLSGLTAWTNDHRIGGYSFYRMPTRDPSLNEHVVELHDCRPQNIRLVDVDSGRPIPGIRFALNTGTPAPDFNIIGKHDKSWLTTDQKGQATERWFPDWDSHFYYAETDSAKWLLAGSRGDPVLENGTLTLKVKRSRISERETVAGRINNRDASVSGLYVNVSSFQGERKHYSDVVSTFANADGSFELSVLPDITYCAHVHDMQRHGEFTDWIPFDSRAGEATQPMLQLANKQDLRVFLTTGPNKEPLAGQQFRVLQDHRFSWREDGRTKFGQASASWNLTSDENGMASFEAPLGKLRISVFTPTWRTEQEVDVSAGEAVDVHLHRESAGMTKVTGRLVAAEGCEASVSGIRLKVGTIDGKFDEQDVVTTHEDGTFSFETPASAIGIFAMTDDRKAAGTLAATDLDSPLEILVQPTVAYEGQIFGEGDKPLADQSIKAMVRIDGNEDYNGIFVKSFRAMEESVKTNAQGYFRFNGLPCTTPISFLAEKSDALPDGKSLGQAYLQPGELRPIAVTHTASNTVATPLNERFERALRDCRLGGFGFIVVTSSDAPEIREFTSRYFSDYRENRDVASFLQIFLSPGKLRSQADKEFAKQRGWSVASGESVFAYALDSSGREMERIRVDTSDAMAIDQIAEFHRKHLPQQVDAQRAWDDAFAEAARTNRAVWARISQRYCLPCFRLARWIDDNRRQLEKDFVLLKVDDVRDENGQKVAEYITRGGRFGVPFHAVFDAQENLVIDSDGPLGNIGHPSGFEGKRHLQEMLLKGRKRLTATEIENLIGSLDD
ncbi:MAG TPA: hypothetical protein DDW52_00210 [Planctomycetaceae bacterium]|nr:hypothetical protein [Planctomycetaceae bacterium]